MCVCLCSYLQFHPLIDESVPKQQRETTAFATLVQAPALSQPRVGRKVQAGSLSVICVRSVFEERMRAACPEKNGKSETGTEKDGRPDWTL